MLKRHDIAAVNHIDGRAILELKPGYLDLGIEPEIDLGIAGSEAARERREEMFARIRQALKRRKVFELVERRSAWRRQRVDGHRHRRRLTPPGVIVAAPTNSPWNRAVALSARRYTPPPKISNKIGIFAQNRTVTRKKSEAPVG